MGFCKIKIFYKSLISAEDLVFGWLAISLSVPLAVFATENGKLEIPNFVHFIFETVLFRPSIALTDQKASFYIFYEDSLVKTLFKCCSIVFNNAYLS